MDRWVAARQRVPGDPAVLRDELSRHLPELLQQVAKVGLQQPAGDGSFVIPLVSDVGEMHLTKKVRVHIGAERRQSLWTRIPVTMEPEGGHTLFPTFDGAVELEQLDDRWTELAVIGHYNPPLGPLGAAADALGLHRTAERTVQWLADGLADRLAKAIHHAAPGTPHEPHRLVVRQVMATRPVVFHESDSVREAARRLLIVGLDGAPVLDAQDRLVGVLSVKDLLDKVAPNPLGFGKKADAARRHHAALTVGEACTRPAVTTEADTRLRDAAREMVRRGVGRLVVLDGAKVVGLITRADALSVLVRATATIHDAACEVVAEIAPDVVVDAEDGVVTLRGAVDTRSKHDYLVASIGDLDGVLEVRGEELKWLRDDTVATMPPM